jgi:hypothetical protein
MKTRFWNVGIEIYEDGTVLAAVLRNRLADTQPAEVYKRQPKREVYSLWFISELAAHTAVIEALGWNTKKQGVAA